VMMDGTFNRYRRVQRIPQHSEVLKGWMRISQ